MRQGLKLRGPVPQSVLPRTSKCPACLLIGVARKFAATVSRSALAGHRSPGRSGGVERPTPERRERSVPSGWAWPPLRRGPDRVGFPSAVAEVSGAEVTNDGPGAGIARPGRRLATPAVGASSRTVPRPAGTTRPAARLRAKAGLRGSPGVGLLPPARRTTGRTRPSRRGTRPPGPSCRSGRGTRAYALGLDSHAGETG